jgi:threonine/homoserine/homoserine lactone efflux protein
MEFILIATAHFLALLSPGPDFFLIMQASLRLPTRYAISVCAGITAANALYLLLAVFSLEALRAMAWLPGVLRYFGGVYLVFLGVMLLKSPMRTFDRPSSTTLLGQRRLGRQFLVGFLSALLNPKNIIFYLALFTTMVSEKTGLFTRCLYALWMTMAVFFWDSGVVLVIGREQVQARLGRSVYLVEKAAGAMLACFGLLLPFT